MATDKKLEIAYYEEDAEAGGSEVVGKEKSAAKETSEDLLDVIFPNLDEDMEEYDMEQIEDDPNEVLPSKDYKCMKRGREYKTEEQFEIHQKCHTKPKHLKCEKCDFTCDLYYRLQQHMHKHDEDRFFCKICDKTFKWKGNLVNHMKLHTGDGVHICDICGKKCVNKSDLTRHKDTHNVNIVYQCQVCNKEFKHKLTYNQHQKIHLGIGLHKCEVCGKECTSSTILAKHIESHDTTAKYECTKCGSKFKNRQVLQYHERLHSGENLLMCPYCGKQFPIQSKLAKHMEGHSVEPQFECTLCGKKYKHERALKRHRQLEHDEGSCYTCEICSKKFPGPATLGYHMDTHAEEAKYECTTCGEKFKKVRQLRYHAKIHTGQDIYKCTICGKVVYTPSALQAHTDIHNNGAQYSCTNCSRTYKHKHSLRLHEQACQKDTLATCHICKKDFKHLGLHMRRHTQKYIYECDVCGKKFLKESKLECHKDVHSDTAKYECKECGKCYKHRFDLASHMKLHSADALVCGICDKPFATRRQLQLHGVVHSHGRPHRSIVSESVSVEADDKVEADTTIVQPDAVSGDTSDDIQCVNVFIKKRRGRPPRTPQSAGASTNNTNPPEKSSEIVQPKSEDDTGNRIIKKSLKEKAAEIAIGSRNNSAVSKPDTPNKNVEVKRKRGRPSRASLSNTSLDSSSQSESLVTSENSPATSEKTLDTLKEVPVISEVVVHNTEVTIKKTRGRPKKSVDTSFVQCESGPGKDSEVEIVNQNTKQEEVDNVNSVTVKVDDEQITNDGSSELDSSQDSKREDFNSVMMPIMVVPFGDATATTNFTTPVKLSGIKVNDSHSRRNISKPLELQTKDSDEPSVFLPTASTEVSVEHVNSELLRAAALGTIAATSTDVSIEVNDNVIFVNSTISGISQENDNVSVCSKADGGNMDGIPVEPERATNIPQLAENMADAEEFLEESSKPNDVGLSHNGQLS